MIRLVPDVHSVRARCQARDAAGRWVETSGTGKRDMHIRISAKLDSAIFARAIRDGVTYSDIIRAALRAYLDQ